MRPAAVVAAFAIFFVFGGTAAVAQSDHAVSRCAAVGAAVERLFSLPTDGNWDELRGVPRVEMTEEYAQKFVRAASLILPRMRVTPSAVLAFVIPRGVGFKAFVVSWGRSNRPWIVFLDEGYFAYPEDEFTAVLGHEFAHGELNLLGGSSRDGTPEEYFDQRAAEIVSIGAVRAALERRRRILESERDAHRFEFGQCPEGFRAFERAMAHANERVAAAYNLQQALLVAEGILRDD